MAENSARNSKKVPASRADPLKPYRWKPGQCGNPNGRPRKQPVTERYLEALEVKLPDEVRVMLGLPKGATMGDAITRRIVIKAVNGSVDAAREIADRVEGKPTQAVKVEGSELPAPIFQITFGRQPALPENGGANGNTIDNTDEVPGQTQRVERLPDTGVADAR